jgi:hypothetical protein
MALNYFHHVGHATDVKQLCRTPLAGQLQDKQTVCSALAVLPDA